MRRGKIPLSMGKVALVDEKDYPRIAAHKWYAAKRGRTYYGVRNIKNSKGKKTVIYMHHVILGRPPQGFWVDHINCDGLDNRRSNLRFVTPSESGSNKLRVSVGRSGFRGVWKNNVGWCAILSCGGVRQYLGNFATPLEAARVYDKAALRALGRFARLNFSRSGQRVAFTAD